MKTAEGKIGRVFILHFESDSNVTDTLLKFANESGISLGYINLLSDAGAGDGLFFPDAQNQVKLQITDATRQYQRAVIYEIAGAAQLLEKPAAVEPPVRTQIVPATTIVHSGDHTHILTAFNVAAG